LYFKIGIKNILNNENTRQEECVRNSRKTYKKYTSKREEILNKILRNSKQVLFQEVWVEKK